MVHSFIFAAFRSEKENEVEEGKK